MKTVLLQRVSDTDRSVLMATIWLVFLNTGCGTDVNVGSDCYHGVCTGCNSTTCEDGCCLDGRCYSPQATACGVAGEECVDCGDKGDRCSDDGVCLCSLTICAGEEICRDGECRCGDREACGDLGECVDGVCQCGGNPACMPGQKCEDSRCVCDETSCPGCCWGGVTCQQDPTPDACGRRGSFCVVCVSGEDCTGGDCHCGDGEGCSSMLADACVDGECLCGETSLCVPGQSCVRGECICNGESCSTGCCSDNNECRVPSAENCGWDGVRCIDCGTSADTCYRETLPCRCGDNPPCRPGRICTEGECF